MSGNDRPCAVIFLKLIGILVLGFILIVYGASLLYSLLFKLNSWTSHGSRGNHPRSVRPAILRRTCRLPRALLCSYALDLFRSPLLRSHTWFLGSPMLALWFSAGANPYLRRRQTNYAQVSTVAFVVFSFKPAWALAFFPYLAGLLQLLGFRS
jgi:hypothetical protein